MSFRDYTTHITDKIKTWVHPYLHEEKKALSSKSCVIYVNGDDTSFLCSDVQHATPEILFNNELNNKTESELKLVFSGLVEQFELTNATVIWLMNPDEYELNLVESMPVPKNEIAAALSWRVRSLINYPIDEAVLEYFELPPKKNSPNSPFIGAVTAKRAKLATNIEYFKSLNLNLNVIDIPELSMLRLSAAYETDEKCTAFIFLFEKMLILNISSQKCLYFTRRINITYNNNNEIDFEKISLEILRYFDFFRSQWRLPAPSRLLTASTIGDITLIAKQLSERLLNTVQPYQILNDNITPPIKQEILARSLLSYGCLLRKGN